VFDALLYEHEMTLMLQHARERLRAEHAGLVIYSISIWTDASAGISAVSVDTKPGCGEQRLSCDCEPLDEDAV
jgi:hypothetical protein